LAFADGAVIVEPFFMTMAQAVNLRAYVYNHTIIAPIEYMRFSEVTNAAGLRRVAVRSGRWPGRAVAVPAGGHSA
jgi:hypothetical protein